jgi:GDSL-like Lipase/Acylhydrolase family/N-terminus of Esterase_SGNH_hydro-type
MFVHRRISLVLVALSLVATSISAGEPVDPGRARTGDDGTLWYDVNLLDVEGRAWDDTTAPFDRLPARAEQLVRDAVWSLSHHSAGMCVRFVTDAATLKATWTLTSSRLEMPHMPATGVSGLDLYVRDDAGAWRWLANGRPSGQTNTVTLVRGIPQGEREYRLYLPLYNGVTSVELGLPAAATLSEPPPYAEGHDKPIVFYGTSITQGGCASRPGMCHPAILGRRFERPIVNLGFSGNGRMEVEVAALMAEIDAAVYVLDCLPNITADDVTARTEPVVRLLREKRPDTPILLVEDRTYADAFLVRSKRERNDTSRAAYRAAFERLQAARVQNLYYLEGEHLLGDDNEGTVDSSHPTDLGFMRQADAFAEVLGPILQ